MGMLPKARLQGKKGNLYRALGNLQFILNVILLREYDITPLLDKEGSKSNYSSAPQSQHSRRKWEFVRRVGRTQWGVVRKNCSSCCCRETFKAQGKARLSHNQIQQDLPNALIQMPKLFILKMLASEIFQGKMWKCLLRKVYSHISKQKWKTRETWKTLDRPLKTLDENKGEEGGKMHLVHC